MSRILKLVIGLVAVAAVAGGAVVVYRETDLLTGSLVVVAGLMIVALVARRAAAREEKAGMADWEDETQASADAAADLFGDWNVTTPIATPSIDQAPPSPAKAPGTPSVAPPVPPPHGTAPASAFPDDASIPEPADPSVAVSRPLLGTDRSDDSEALVARLFERPPDASTPAPTTPPPTVPPPGAAPAPTAGPNRDPFGLGTAGTSAPTGSPAPSDRPGSAPAPTSVPAPAPEPAMAGAMAGARSPIDWSGGQVDEQVRSSDDILRASDATALPHADPGGGELARLLAKVEARLRDYD